MSDVIEILTGPHGKDIKSVFFHCPGCNGTHGVPFEGHRAWQFNGDLEKPTISPSLLINAHMKNKTRCHLFVKGGKIEFLGDCDHELAGKTVDMEVVE